jgi:hypothetical protein
MPDGKKEVDSDPFSSAEQGFSAEIDATYRDYADLSGDAGRVPEGSDCRRAGRVPEGGPSAGGRPTAGEVRAVAGRRPQVPAARPARWRGSALETTRGRKDSPLDDLRLAICTESGCHQVRLTQSANCYLRYKRYISGGRHAVNLTETHPSGTLVHVDYARDYVRVR